MQIQTPQPPRDTLRNGIYDLLTLQSIGLKGYVWTLARIDARRSADFKVLKWSQITPDYYAR